MDSVIRSPSDPINLGDVSGYGNVSIRVKDSAIKMLYWGCMTKEKDAHNKKVRNKVEMITAHFPTQKMY